MVVRGEGESRVSQGWALYMNQSPVYTYSTKTTFRIRDGNVVQPAWKSEPPKQFSVPVNRHGGSASGFQDQVSRLSSPLL